MRADRLLSMMILLQARGRMTAEDLAVELEVSERTIYRDIDALSIAGVPVYTQSGVNGGVFLDDNYRLTLNSLSLDEIRSLFISGASSALADLGMQSTVEDSLLKLLSALPSMHRNEAERVRNRLHIDQRHWFQTIDPPPFLNQLQEAIWNDRIVRLQYGAFSGEANHRDVEAYALVTKANIWYFVCRRLDNGEMRSYRVSRIIDMSITREHFQRQSGFKLAEFWQQQCKEFEAQIMAQEPPYKVRLQVHQSARGELETTMFGQIKRLDDVGEWMRYEVWFDSMSDACMRLMALGQSAIIEAPEELIQVVRDKSYAIWQHYQVDHQ